MKEQDRKPSKRYCHCFFNNTISLHTKYNYKGVTTLHILIFKTDSGSRNRFLLQRFRYLQVPIFIFFWS